MAVCIHNFVNSCEGYPRPLPEYQLIIFKVRYASPLYTVLLDTLHILSC